jgi:hypothetical protein
VTGRSDRHSHPVKPGDNRLEVSYLATQGALMHAVTVAGRTGTASIGTEHGHPVYTVDLELPRGTSRTIVLHLSEPAWHRHRSCCANRWYVRCTWRSTPPAAAELAGQFPRPRLGCARTLRKRAT